MARYVLRRLGWISQVLVIETTEEWSQRHLELMKTAIPITDILEIIGLSLSLQSHGDKKMSKEIPRATVGPWCLLLLNTASRPCYPRAVTLSALDMAPVLHALHSAMLRRCRYLKRPQNPGRKPLWMTGPPRRTPTGQHEPGEQSYQQGNRLWFQCRRAASVWPWHRAIKEVAPLHYREQQ